MEDWLQWRLQLVRNFFFERTPSNQQYIHPLLNQKQLICTACVHGNETRLSFLVVMPSYDGGVCSGAVWQGLEFAVPWTRAVRKKRQKALHVHSHGQPEVPYTGLLHIIHKLINWGGHEEVLKMTALQMSRCVPYIPRKRESSLWEDNVIFIANFCSPLVYMSSVCLQSFLVPIKYGKEY